jgi:hypothetical protein
MRTVIAVLTGLAIGAAGGVGVGYAVWHRHETATAPALPSFGRCTPSARQRVEDLDNMPQGVARIVRNQWETSMTRHQLDDIEACEAQR